VVAREQKIRAIAEIDKHQKPSLDIDLRRSAARVNSVGATLPTITCTSTIALMNTTKLLAARAIQFFNNPSGSQAAYSSGLRQVATMRSCMNATGELRDINRHFLRLEEIGRGALSSPWSKTD